MNTVTASPEQATLNTAEEPIETPPPPEHSNRRGKKCGRLRDKKRCGSTSRRSDAGGNEASAKDGMQPLNKAAITTNTAASASMVLEPDLEEAARFLDLLDPSGQHTFQTFSESENATGAARYPKILHGTLDEHADSCRLLTSKGALSS